MFAIDSILLIFIIFAIFRAVSSSGQKSAQQKKAEETRRHAQQQARRRQDAESPTPAEKPYADLVRQLQMEFDQEKQRQQQKPKAKQKQKTKTKRQVEGQVTMDKGQPYRQVEGECFDMQHSHQPDTQEPLRPNQQGIREKRQPGQTPIAAPMAGASVPQRAVFPQETLVQGIIMAEILGPPLAKRKRR